MITLTYAWKSEFNKDEKEVIEVCRQVNRTLSNPKHREKLPDVVLIAEMANALDRYEAILNEMEEDNRRKETG